MLTYDIKNRNGRSKTVWLYEEIRQDIAAGKLPAGERLPSRRDLAEHLGISVITVENAYRMLEEEGYVVSRPRSGFYVNSLPALRQSLPCGEIENTSSGRTEDIFTMQLLPEEAEDHLDENGAPDLAMLSPEASSPQQLPVPGMARYVRRILSEYPDIMLRKPPHLGCAVLRNEIAGYLLRFRGMQVQPANILIGSGAEYLYGIVVQLLGRDKLYGIEDPSYQKIRLVYEANGARTEPLAMGKDGVRTEALENANADILHVSPFHSYPSGVTASPAKRHKYLSWAKERDAVIIEEDFDSEFTFFRKPMETLYSLDGGQRVIYMNTFSKSIAPGMRIAYMVLPESMMKEYEKRLGFYSCTVPVFDQYVLAAFISDGGFERHLGRIRRNRFA